MRSSFACATRRDSIDEFLASNEEFRIQLEELQSARQELQRQVNLGILDPKHPMQKYIDPIDRSIMVDPVTADDGNTYERKNINLWIESAKVNDEGLLSPVTREKMGATLTPDPRLKEEIKQVM